MKSFYKKLVCDICDKKMICRSEKNYPGVFAIFKDTHKECELMKHIYRVYIKKTKEVN